MRRLTDRKIALFLFFAAICVYNANFRLIGSGDTLPAQYIPLEIWKSHTVNLDRVRAEITRYTDDPYWVWQSPAGRLASSYPIVTPVVVAPLYLPAFLDLELRGWTPARADSIRRQMEKLSASILAAASVGLIFILLRRRLPARASALLTIAYAFGTETWSISSQALWQHGLGELLVVVALLGLTGRQGRASAIVVGLACGLMAMNRPPDAILAAGTFVALLFGNRRLAPLAAGAAIVAALPFLCYNVATYGTPLGAYASATHDSRHLAAFFQSPRAIGIAGLLASPGKGLFVFSPFLLFLLLRLKRRFRGEGDGRLELCLTSAVVVQVFLYAGYNWEAGDSYGPRYLTDILPIFVFLLAPVLVGMSRRSRAVFGAALAFSIGVQIVGAFYYPEGRSDRCIFAPSGLAIAGGNAWNPECTPFILETRNGPARPVFLDEALNFFWSRFRR